MKTCVVCSAKIQSGKKCLDCKSGSHGLSLSEMKKIAELQNWKCPVLGTPFELTDGKIIDMDPMSKKHQRVCVDHCHSTGVIRGLLSDMGNMLVGGFDRRRYGITSDYPPKTIKDYFEKQYAQSIVGNRQFI
jgi:hypothetical protein